MDSETANLILALQWYDLEQLKVMSKGKGRESDTLSDSDLAMQLQQQEYEQAANQMADRRMAESINRAVLDDGASVLILASEENQAANDHTLAYSLASPREKAACDRNLAVQLNLRSIQSTPRLSSLASDDDNMSWYSAVNNRDDDVDDNDSKMDISEDGHEAESSAWAESRCSESHQERCVSCQEMKEIVEVPCRHLYCRDCVRHLFTDATIDETLFPPRCCRQQVPVSLVRHFLGSDLTSRVEQKAIELGTPNRTYCSDPSCAAFIAPHRIQDSTGTCPMLGCGVRTCVLCKRAAHSGDCPHVDPFGDTLKLAQELGWQRCERCKTLVELSLGCNHIT
ncbi:MAG: hypothetical protein Q9218_001906 [Villophora microphyllina]